MRCMAKNKQKFYYCLFQSKVPNTDSQGRKTGGYRTVYGDAVEAMGNISAATGESQAEVFGSMEDYDKVIVVDNAGPVMDENTVLFVDKSPAYGKDGTPLFDYTVKRVARSLNSISYAIRKAEVT